MGKLSSPGSYSTIQGGPQLGTAKSSDFHSCSCRWQKSSCLSRFPLYPSLHSTAIPLTLMFSLYSHVLPGCDSREADMDIPPHQCIQAGLLEPSCPHHQLALTGWKAMVIMSCHTKLWAPVSTGELAGSGEQHCTLCCAPA